MQSTQTPSTEPVVQVPVMVAAELQDSLLVVMRDLHRLEGLLNHATTNLLERFSEANVLLSGDSVGEDPGVDAARAALRARPGSKFTGGGALGKPGGYSRANISAMSGSLSQAANGLSPLPS